MKKWLGAVKGWMPTGKRLVGTLAVGVVLCGGYASYRLASIVKIGAHSTTYTYADIREVYSFGNKLAALRGAKPIPNYASVFQSMMLAGIEQEIGVARKFPQIDIEKATAFVISQSPYAGVLIEEKEKIGLKRFYKLFVMPLLIDADFGKYYLAKDPNRQIAEAALKAAQQGGLEAAAAKVGNPAHRITIPITNETALLAAEAKKSIGAVMPKYAEDGSGYAVMIPAEVTDTQIVADVVNVQRMAVSAFIDQELKDAKVPVNDRFYSYFRVADLRDKGGILAGATSEKKEKASEGDR